MKVIKQIKMDLQNKQNVPVIDAMQGDGNTRVLEFSLYSGGIVWNVPDGVSVAVAYMRPDGAKGIYDTLADGSSAVSVANNLVSAILVPQAIAVAGETKLTVVFTTADGNQLATFCVVLKVESNPAIGAVEPEDYINLRQVLVEMVDKAMQEMGATGTFRVTITESPWAADKTYAEIYAAHQAGQAVECVLSNGEVLALFGAHPEAAIFQNINDRYYSRIVVKADDTVTYNSGHYALLKELPPGVFYVKLALEDDGTYTADQTVDDVALALDAGSPVYCLYPDGGVFSVAQLVKCYDATAIFKGITEDGNGICTVTITADGATVEVSAGGTGEPGADGGYYSPTVADNGDGTMEMSFTPSTADMPAVAPKTIALPVGPQGTQGEKGPKGDTGATGEQGTPGYTPVRGVDYYTDADKSEFSEYIASELAKRGQLEPLFANSIEECTDTTKLYVLPDGFIYAYMLTEVEEKPTYKNWLTYSVNQDGSDYKGDNGEDGYRKGYRWSASSKAEKAVTGYDCIGFIPVRANDVVRVKNVSNITTSSDPSNYATAHCLGSDFEQVGGATYFSNSDNQITMDNGAYMFTVPNNSAIRWCKMTLMGVTDATIITINEPITEGGGTSIEYAWANTGHAFVPADYEDRIVAVENAAAQHTTQIAALEKAVETGGADASEKAAHDRIKNWKYPIHEDAPVFLLETNKPAIGSDEQTTAAVYAKYDALMAANPDFITKVNCGMASDGTTPIHVYHFKESTPHYSSAVWSETKPVILVCSGVHPTEQSGVHSLYYAMEEITTNPKLRDLRRNVHFIVMPMINPTGFTDSTYGVRNPDGIQVHYNFEVDFKYPTDSGYVANGNRNHGGETPLSIPETQYFDALMGEYKDTLAIVVSCHNNDVDEQYGTGFIWASCATHFMCNLGFRFADKMSAAWREKHGTAFDEGVRWANEYALAQANAGSSLFNTTITKEQPEWDYRVGRASISGSGGTEYKQAIKYGVHGINVEVCDRCMILDKDFTKKRTANVTTMGCETYVNFFRTFMAVYDPKDKKDYAPNLPWSE